MLARGLGVQVLRRRRPAGGRNIPPPRVHVPPAVPEPGTAYAPSQGCRLAAERWPDGRVACHFNGRWLEADAETFRPS